MFLPACARCKARVPPPAPVPITIASYSPCAFTRARYQVYPTENGFNLPTDVIEFPSQFNEHWALDPKVFANYAKHHQTGAPMPQVLVDIPPVKSISGSPDGMKKITGKSIGIETYQGLPAAGGLPRKRRIFGIEIRQ